LLYPCSTLALLLLFSSLLFTGFLKDGKDGRELRASEM
jgi:hypothetical protein